MKPSELKSEIAKRFQAGIKRPLHVISSPGIGKTQIAGQAAKELGIGFKAIHAPLLQPEDYGFPVIGADKQDVRFIVSREKFPVVGADCPDKGIFLVDELPQADNSAQKILANLFQEREIHGQRLKDGWAIVSTGNRTTDRAGANRLLSHLKDRVTEVPLDPSLDDWTQWAIENGVKPEVIAFIRFRPALLSAFDPQAEKSPTPRAWVEGVSAALGITSPNLELATFTGDVGEGAAAEFCGFIKIFRELPSPDVIALNPLTAPVSDKPAVHYAVCGSLAHRATDANFGRFMQYVARLPREFSVLYVRDAIRCRQPSRGSDGKAKQCGKCSACAIQSSADFMKWASGDGAKLLS